MLPYEKNEAPLWLAEEIKGKWEEMDGCLGWGEVQWEGSQKVQRASYLQEAAQSWLEQNQGS